MKIQNTNVIGPTTCSQITYTV